MTRHFAKAGLMGPASGYLWMFVDGIAGNVEGAQATAEVDGEGEFGAPAVVLADVWMGSMGSIPLAPSGAKYDQFLLDYQAQSSTLGTCGGSDVDLTDSCACDQTKDNAGNLLFQHDHDLDDATPDKCAGFVYDPSDVDYSAPNAYSYLAFDAVWALAVAANSLIEDGATEFGGSQMQEALKSISFEGITGTVDFESNGDREVGVGFTIMNWASSDGYVTLGNWDKDSGLVYEDGAEASIVYATEDNSSPPDIILPSCNTDDIIPTVAEKCSSAGKRAVIYAIKTNPETGDDVCEGGVPKPANKDLDCEYTPTDSSTGVLAVLLGIVGAGICALWTIWVLLNFNTKVSSGRSSDVHESLTNYPSLN